MEADLFRNVPLEIRSNILLRLPLRSIAISKCVCKPWLHLLESDDLVKSHLSKPALAVLTQDSTRFTVFNLEDEDGVDLESHDRHYNLLTDFDIPHSRGAATLEGTSANGLLLIFSKPETFYICNPLTRDYVELPCPQESSYTQRWICGFGVSKVSGQHKVVCMKPHKPDCHVYTLERGQTWRRVPKFGYYIFFDDGYGMCNFGKIAEGNLHWTVWDPNSVNSRRICCFDVETECFSSFSAPPGGGDVDLSVLRDCLCACHITWDEDDQVIEIWSMKEYGVEESWRKEYVIIQNPDFGRDDQLPPFYYPIKVFKDGDILMLWEEKLLIYYSNNAKTTQQIGVFAGVAGDNYNYNYNYTYAMIFTPSLFSLKSLGMENVISFN